MKTKLLAVGIATIMGAGAYMHSGSKPRCPLQFLFTEKKVAKAPSQMATLTNEQKDKAKKEQLAKDLEQKKQGKGFCE